MNYYTYLPEMIENTLSMEVGVLLYNWNNLTILFLDPMVQQNMVP